MKTAPASTSGNKGRFAVGSSAHAVYGGELLITLLYVGTREVDVFVRHIQTRVAEQAHEHDFLTAIHLAFDGERVPERVREAADMIQSRCLSKPLDELEYTPARERASGARP